MTKQEADALQEVINRYGLVPHWAGSGYVSQVGSGVIEDGIYRDSVITGWAIHSIELSEIELCKIEDAEVLVEEWLLAQEFANA